MAIDDVTADRGLVEVLHAHGYLTTTARQAALDFLNPHDQWSLWISRLLLVVGSVLVLSGVVYFFAFNWNQIPPAAKFASIQIGIVALVGAACLGGLKRTNGQVLMVGASVLVGVFLAVFGQVYQTGANAYELFATWSILIFGWCLISNFAPQWSVWLAVTNVALILWWRQGALPTEEMAFLIYGYQALFNGAALALREWGVRRGFDWIAPRWTRVLLALATLWALLVPSAAMILGDDPTTSMLATGIVGLIGHVVLFIVYRHLLRDAWAISATVLSGCLVLDAAAYRVFDTAFGDAKAEIWLGSGLATLVIFTAATVYLRSVAAKLAHD